MMTSPYIEVVDRNNEHGDTACTETRHLWIYDASFAYQEGYELVCFRPNGNAIFKRHNHISGWLFTLLSVVYGLMFCITLVATYNTWNWIWP